MGYVANGSSSTSYPYVTISSATMKFKKWITTVAAMTSDEKDAAAAVTNIPAGNIDNLKLTGVWISVANVTVVFPSYADLAASVWMSSYTVGSGSPVNITTNELVPIAASTGDIIVFTYDDSKVSGVTASVTNGRDTATATVDASAKTVTFDTSSLTNAEGRWFLTISGVGAYTDAGSADTRQVSQEFVITLN